MTSAAALSVQDVATRYGISPAVVLHWIGTRQLRATNVSRAPNAKRPTWRVTAEAVAEFEQRRTPTPAPPVERRQRRAKPGNVVEFY